MANSEERSYPYIRLMLEKCGICVRQAVRRAYDRTGLGRVLKGLIVSAIALFAIVLIAVVAELSVVVTLSAALGVFAAVMASSIFLCAGPQRKST